jgi:methionine-gamma-lyase
VKFTKINVKFETKCVHAAEESDPVFGTYTTPKYHTSTFIFENARWGAARIAGEEVLYIFGVFVKFT